MQTEISCNGPRSGGGEPGGREGDDVAAAAVGVRALLSALEARDNSTGKHSTAVAELVQVTARGMGLADGEVAHAGQIALMHDIGKVGIPDAILHKPGPLTQSDWRVMRRHPEIGERIVASVGALAHLAPAVRAEHERWDGDGYPDGLREQPSRCPVAWCSPAMPMRR